MAARERIATYVALGVLTACTTAVCFGATAFTPSQRAWLIGIGLVAWVVAVVTIRRATVALMPIVIAIAITMAAAVATPTERSDDIFAYTMYGRIVAEHHDNPWREPPSRYPDDPMQEHVSKMWIHTADIYGPGFTGLMVAAAPVIGTSTLAARLVYQAIAALAVAVSLLLLWRRTRNVAVLAFAGLFPVTAASVVNGGHPDALIALGMLAGVLLLYDGHPVGAGFAFAAAVSINATMLAPAGVLTVWAWRRWGVRKAAPFAAVVAIVGALPYAFLGGWFETAHEHSRLLSRQSPWNTVSSLLTPGSPVSIAHLGTESMASVAGTGASLLSAALLLVVLFRYTRGSGAYATAAAVAVFVIASAWIMPWYGFVALPLFALSRINLLAWGVGLYSGAIFLGDQYPRLASEFVGTALQNVMQVVVPIAGLVVIVGALVFGAKVPSDEPETVEPETVEPETDELVTDERAPATSA